jgi:hypothetical protein
MLLKKMEDAKDITIQREFIYKADDQPNVVKNISYYYLNNCRSDFVMMTHIGGTTDAKTTHRVMTDAKIHVAAQIIDMRYKCNYLITKNGYIVPTLPSGIIYNVPIEETLSPYVKDYKDTKKFLEELHGKIGEHIDLSPIGAFYTKKTSSGYTIESIMTKYYDIVPVNTTQLTKKYIDTENIIIQNKPRDDIIDISISKGRDDNNVDKRIESASKSKYVTELYQIFRLHISYYLTKTLTGGKYKKELMNMLSKSASRNSIKELIYRMCSPRLLKQFMEVVKNIQKGGNENEWIAILPDKNINYPGIEIHNNREVCNLANKATCQSLHYCQWADKKSACTMEIREDYFIDFVNRITEEIIQNTYKLWELLRKDSYFVSDINDYTTFNVTPGENIIFGSSANIDQELKDIFGDENIPNIIKFQPASQDSYDKSGDHPLKIVGQWYSQAVVDNNIIFRAFSNGYYWLLHPFNDVNTRNLGYYSDAQTKLASYYKGQVIDWFQQVQNDKISIRQYLYGLSIDEYLTAIKRSSSVSTPGIIEFFILSTIHKTIVYIYNKNMNISKVIHPTDGIVYDDVKSSTSFTNKKYTNYKKYINIQIITDNDRKSFFEVSVLYPIKD